MNFTLSGTPRLRHALSQLISRNTSKIAVELDGALLTKLENDEVKSRNHPGIVKANHLELPTHINHALQRVIGDHPVKKLLQDCVRLNQYLRSRHPPPEAKETRERLRSIAEEIDKRLPAPQPKDTEQLSEADKEKWLRKREQAMRRVLGQRTYAWKPIAFNSYEALIYAIGRGAHEYAVLVRILSELEARDPQFKPRSYFDFGSGVGTGMWAASSFWQDSIFEYYNVDSSREMHDLSELILREGHENQQLTLRNVFYRQFLPGLDTKYELIVSSYSLFELPSAQNRKEVLLNLWRKCDGYLIIVEEGTRRGTELVNEARDFILGLEGVDMRGHVFAPCAHDLPCPRLADEADRTPCNFEVSFEPLRIGSVHAKRLTARYSYVVLRKGAPQDETHKWPRLVRPTLQRSGHVICRMCTADAKLQEVIFTKAKHGKPAYKCAKASRWGDRLPIALGERFETITKTKSIRKTVDAVVETAADTNT